MKIVYKLVSVLTVWLLIATSMLAQNENEQLEISHGPYLIEPGFDCITINWTTNKACQSWVEFCGDTNLGTFPKWGGYPEKVYPSNQGLLEANTTLHSVRLIGLEPGTIYRYRVMSKEILQYNPYEVIYGDTAAGEIFEFETLSNAVSEFSFAAISDIHERSKELDKLLSMTSPDSIAMMFYVGDMLNWIGDEERIFNGMVDVSVDRFATTKPMILARGNHETRGPEARKLFSYFPHSSGQYYFAFTQGEVRFIILDPGEDKTDDHPVYAGLVDFDNYRTEQEKWLEKEVKSEAFLKAKYKLVMCHIPPFSKSTAHGATDITKKWGGIFNSAKIDLIISGHHHRYSLIDSDANKNNMPVVILGQDMLLNADVKANAINIQVNDIEGNEVDAITVKSKP
ncbi:metallophosphoesterase [Carboxylicivirga sp. N1Y90]|uniref:metallophosphoesterase n=1 Tax=Carboxylicivirga fragile TaxID=3417571 RepID=UPI003D32C7EF|nr:metallophosphoesterase family protein [Marinilabiliaceae bacterium N1Y90]